MKRISLWIGRAWPVVLVAVVVIGLDQWTKYLVRDAIPMFAYVVPVAAIGGYFRFEHVPNYGAAFGLFQGMGSFFVVVAFVVAAVILYYAVVLPPRQRGIRVLLGLQLGGALGNVIDRLYQGYVTDFIKMGIPGVYDWPNYNIADSAIVVGVISLGIYILSEDLRSQRAPAADPASAHVPVSQEDV
jgi:signal peptidase II